MPPGHRLHSTLALGSAYLAQGNEVQAKQLLESYTKQSTVQNALFPSMIVAQLLLMECWLQEKNSGEASRIFDKIQVLEKKHLLETTSKQAKVDAVMQYLSDLTQAHATFAKYHNQKLEQSALRLLRATAKVLDASVPFNVQAQSWPDLWKRVEASALAWDRVQTEKRLSTGVEESLRRRKPSTLTEVGLLVPVVGIVSSRGFDYSQAVPVLMKCLVIYDSTFGAESAQSLTVHAFLAQNSSIHHDDNCADHWLAMVRIQRKVAPDGADTISWLIEAGKCLLKRHQYAQAEQIFNEARAIALKAGINAKIPVIGK
jgi:tetratricopeptide (TPR) repeat protein